MSDGVRAAFERWLDNEAGDLDHFQQRLAWKAYASGAKAEREAFRQLTDDQIDLMLQAYDLYQIKSDKGWAQRQEGMRLAIAAAIRARGRK